MHDIHIVAKCYILHKVLFPHKDKNHLNLQKTSHNPANLPKGILGQQIFQGPYMSGCTLHVEKLSHSILDLAIDVK